MSPAYLLAEQFRGRSAGHDRAIEARLMNQRDGENDRARKKG